MKSCFSGLIIELQLWNVSILLAKGIFFSSFSLNSVNSANTEIIHIAVLVKKDYG